MIEFKRVYRQSGPGNRRDVVMAPIVLPQAVGVWVLRSCPTHIETQVLGTVFEGNDGRFVVLTTDGPVTFEPLTLLRLEEMKQSIMDYETFHTRFKTDADLCDWYWDEFAVSSDGEEVNREGTYAKLKEMFE